MIVWKHYQACNYSKKYRKSIRKEYKMLMLFGILPIFVICTIHTEL